MSSNKTKCLNSVMKLTPILTLNGSVQQSFGAVLTHKLSRVHLATTSFLVFVALSR
jgi:hypothetical protein